MKKLIHLNFIFISILIMISSVNAQNLVVNGDLESWTNSTTPDGWDKIENVFQENTVIYEGTYSVKHVSQNSTTDFSQDVEGIVPGNNYTISYWYLDNDPAARYRIWSYWLNGEETIDDNGEVLRPSEYSTDNPDWIKWETQLVAPATADGFRLEVRVYKENSTFGGAVYYDDFVIETSGVNPEPSNFPENFAAEASALNIQLTWDDATGEQEPSAYLILGSDSDDIDDPVDGTPVADDTDFSDGTGALNIAQGVQMAEFKNLQTQTTYYFKIYPYTNGGANIDYKTDGDPPASNATTANLSIIQFMDFNNGWEGWIPEDVLGAQSWGTDNTFGLEGTPCALMSGFSGQPIPNEDWLISRPMNFEQYEGEVLEFWTARNFSGPDLELLISNDYSGSGDPNAATWSPLSAEYSTSGWEWTPSGVVDVSGIMGESVYVAFKYTSDASGAASWEVDDVVITGIPKTGLPDEMINEYVKVYPNPASSRVYMDPGVDRYSYKLLSIDGRVITAGEGTKESILDVSSVTPGLYLLHISGNNDKVSVIKLMISRDR
jgi:hypothetical protein